MGTVVCSVDAELGWGFHDFDEPPGDRLANARRGWRALVDCCAEYRVPATWAVVGHLFLEDCDGRHREHPAPQGWFAHERGPDRLARSLRFADGLIDRIVESPVDHEIGIHTFSHVEMGAPEVSAHQADAEVAAALYCARERGFEPRSLVFPRNDVGHLRALADNGITCYRGTRPTDDRRGDGDGAVDKVARATVSDAGPPLVRARRNFFGLVNVPASLYLFGFEGVARSVAEPLVGDPIVEQARRGIDQAASEDGIFHMWLHPNNLVAPRDVRRMRSIFQHLARVRARTDLEVRTMGEIAADVLAADAPHEKAVTDGAD